MATLADVAQLTRELMADPAGDTYLLVTSTVVAGIAAGVQTVTPTSMVGISVGVSVLARNAIGTNSEVVIVSATTPTTFTATFTSAKAGNWVVVSSTILQAINAAYRDVGWKMKEQGVRLFRGQQTIANFPLNTLTLSRTTTPGLSSDFLQPIEIWEKDVGAADTEYTPVEPAEDELPDVEQGESLGVYYWRLGTITFIGATTARTLRIDYVKDIVDLVVGTDTLAIDGALDAVSYLAAAILSRARGQTDQASFYEAKGNAAIDQLVNLEVQNLQRSPRRRWYSRTPTWRDVY